VQGALQATGPLPDLRPHEAYYSYDSKDKNHTQSFEEKYFKSSRPARGVV
jgi:hypothetical protein